VKLSPVITYVKPVIPPHSLPIVLTSALRGIFFYVPSNKRLLIVWEGAKVSWGGDRPQCCANVKLVFVSALDTLSKAYVSGAGGWYRVSVIH